jgi:hypothetical protein
MANKTAVQWLAEQMLHPELYNPYIEEALQMEKQQIINAVEWNYKSNMGEVYYNATYSELPTEPTQQKTNNHIPMGGCI